MSAITRPPRTRAENSHGINEPSVLCIRARARAVVASRSEACRNKSRKIDSPRVICDSLSNSPREFLRDSTEYHSRSTLTYTRAFQRSCFSPRDIASRYRRNRNFRLIPSISRAVCMSFALRYPAQKTIQRYVCGYVFRAALVKIPAIFISERRIGSRRRAFRRVA